MSAEPRTGVTFPRGFLAAAAHAGIRKKAPDVALVMSERDAVSACVFTRNLVQAAPLVVCREHLERSGGAARAVLVNAGNANACTGEPGLVAARACAQSVAVAAGVPTEQVLVSSTGVIGQLLPHDKVVAVVPALVASLSRDGHDAAAKAIMTTDLVQKEAAREVRLSGGLVRLGGMAKGSGMIHPDMATTLAVVTTDARVPPAFLARALRAATDRTFNRISVDGDTSTNDMIAMLANGASGVVVEPSDETSFRGALESLLLELAKSIARDGEGAKKLIEITVTGARSEAEALQVSRTIASSPLVKTAVAGEDANWGRIVAAVGRAGVDISPELLRVRLGDVEVLSPGYRSTHAEDDATRAVSGDTVIITVDLGLGAAQATTWTCDLTHGYIDINGSYRS